MFSYLIAAAALLPFCAIVLALAIAIVLDVFREIKKCLTFKK